MIPIYNIKVLLSDYFRYHDWMASPELQKLTASEPLSLDEEYQMQESWRQDEDSKIILRFIKHKVNGSHFIFQN